ncbi:MAG: short-chain dehydrogenase, partial [Pseudomonadota bacterium]
LAEGLHVELKPYGVDVLSAAPTSVSTGFGARAGMNMRVSQAPHSVAKDIVSALGRSNVSHPGWLTKFQAFGLGMLPRRLRVRVMGRIMRRMAVAPAEDQPSDIKRAA